MASSLYSPFYSKASSEIDWEFSGPKGNGLKNRGGHWNWSDTKTPSNKTGPNTGHTHGYVYTESGSPTKAGSVFTMTTINSFDAKSSEIIVSYYYNSNTDTPCTLEVFGWDGFKWRLEDTIQPALHELGDEWIKNTFKIEDYANTDCRIRFKVTIGEGGRSYRKDFALDSISIMASNSDTDEFVTYFETKNISKKRKFSNIFDAKHKTKAEFDTVYEEFKTKLKTFNWNKYKQSKVVVHDPDGNVHVFSEGDN